MSWTDPARRGACLALLLVLPAAPAGAEAVWELANAINEPGLGERIELDGPIEVGRATIRPAAGTAVRPILAAGRPAGLLVAGPATLSYRVTDQFSVPVAQRNLRRAAGLAATERAGGLEISEPLDGAALWGWGLAPENAGGDPEAERDRLPEWAQDVVDNCIFPGPANVLVPESYLEGSGPRGTVWAVFKASRRELLLDLDPVFEGLESLYLLETLGARSGVKGTVIRHNLADQPVGREWWEPTQPFLVAERQHIEARNTGDAEMTIKTTTRLRAVRGGLRLWSTGLRGSIWNRSKERLETVSVETVTVNGTRTSWKHGDHQLMVDLRRALSAGESVEVEVVHEGPLAQRPNNDAYWSLTTWSWHPSPPMNAQRAEVEIELSVPEPWIPFASGDTLSRTSADGYNTVHTRLAGPMQWPSVAAGKFHAFSEERNGIECTVATYAFGKERAAEQLTNLFFAAAQQLGHFFDIPYPFKEVDVVEINSWGFGQAPPGVIFITQEAYDPIGATLNRLFSQGINGRYVHEVAHAWWGHVVKMPNPAEQWITESFAEYSAALAIRAMAGGKKGDREFAATLRAWKSNVADIGDGGSIYLANYLAGEDEGDFRARHHLLYDKGPYVLHALRQELARLKGGAEQGDRYFQAFLRAVLKNFTYGYGETRHLIGILNQMTDHDWQPWFERYVYGTEVPEVKL